MLRYIYLMNQQPKKVFLCIFQSCAAEQDAPQNFSKRQTEKNDTNTLIKLHKENSFNTTVSASEPKTLSKHV